MDSENPFLSLHKGTSVLLNVFHRADSNGDGMISKDEFLDFFWDGAATHEELLQLFEDINVHNTGTLDASELCSFLWRFLGPFAMVLAALEDLNSATTTACCQTEEAYQSLTPTEQFITRLMLREVKYQISKVQQLIDDCTNKVDKETIPLVDNSDDSSSSSEEESTPSVKCENNPLPPPTQPPPPPPTADKPPKSKRQVLTQTSLQFEGNAEDHSSDDLSFQIKKLGRLVRQIENQPVLRKVTEMQVETDYSDCNMLFLMQQSIPVELGAIESFKKVIIDYANEVRGSPGCEQVDALWYKDMSTYIIYELWDSEDSWFNHASTPLYKTFQHQIVDILRKPEHEFNTMEIPASWLHEIV